MLQRHVCCHYTIPHSSDGTAVPTISPSSRQASLSEADSFGQRRFTIWTGSPSGGRCPWWWVITVRRTCARQVCPSSNSFSFKRRFHISAMCAMVSSVGQTVLYLDDDSPGAQWSGPPDGSTSSGTPWMAY